jgi:hypothetical protein
MSPLNAVTFIENHDTDLGAGAVVFNKLLGYAYILTSEGYPCVYYRDYSTDRNCYGLKPQIDNLIWIHEKLAFGTTQQRWKDFDVFAYEREGGARLLVGLNNDPGNARTIEVATGFGANVALHDYSGHAADVATDGSGSVRITIPRNINGLGYVCYSRTGVDGGLGPTSRSVTQVFEGADDLDILPALNTKTIQVARLWSAAQSAIEVRLEIERTGWLPDTRVTLDLLGPDHQVLASATGTRDAAQGIVVRATSVQSGFHAVRLAAVGLPAAKPRASYSLTARYTATQSLPRVIQGLANNEEAARTQGSWGPVFALPNVGIHAHILPDGRVLLWGRRDKPTDSLDVQECTPFVWDPKTKGIMRTPQPALADGTKVNLFCSGHTFLPDGKLLVIGGHLEDEKGVNQVAIYDWEHNTWAPTALMNHGRWYPTAVTLANGEVLACAGTYADAAGNIQHNDVQQVWSNGAWHSLVNFVGLMPYPRMHVAPSGQVFMSGPLATTYSLDTGGAGTWTPVGNRAHGAREYAPSVMYDVGKTLYIGGGNNPDTQKPTDAAEIIDLTAATPAWRPTGAMHFARRQHNATILPDGTVLVTGGTQGGGGPNNGFNDLTPGASVHAAELWDPHTNAWTLLASENIDRCYHATAVLLPDATVLSAGGGEYRPDGRADNDPKDSHRDAQIFSPPYLFKGARPEIQQAPDQVTYGQSFVVSSAQAGQIGQVTWIRLPSVTHSFDQNQRINFLAFSVQGSTLTIRAPSGPNVCPPGHYMLFLLNKSGVPSVARIVQIRLPVAPAVARLAAIPVAAEGRSATAAQDAAVLASATGTRVTVGLTSTCPYGISACWGGAYEALHHLQGVQAVRPIPNAGDSTAEVYLNHRGLPEVDKWPGELARTANGSYLFRGVEVTIAGTVEQRAGDLVMLGTEDRPPVLLAPLQAADKIQWNHKAGVVRPLQESEQLAYQRLVDRMKDASAPFSATVTGPLRKSERGYVLYARSWEQ